MQVREINPEGVTEADVVIGIPSYNEAANIAFPTLKANEGLIRYFGKRRSVIINCDNNSDDDTPNVFLATATDVPKICLLTEPGVRGKGNNLRNLFRKALELGARSVAVVDADLKSITPQWIKHLAEPLDNDFGFVTPLYVRHKYDGTITNSIAYPLTRCLYGRRVRQPIGGDFGFSGNMAEIFNLANHWSPYVGNFGIDIWMTTLAMNHSIPICQSFMGRPRIHKPKAAEHTSGALFREVVGAVFEMMIPYAPFWKRIRHSRPTSIYGFGLGESEMPPPVNVNQAALYDRMADGFKTCLDLWREIFSDDVYGQILDARSASLDRFDFPIRTWVRVLFETAVAFKKSPAQDRDRLLEALAPLYYGKTLSFVRKTERMTIQQTEEFIENECVVFEENKPYLVERWPL